MEKGSWKHLRARETLKGREGRNISQNRIIDIFHHVLKWLCAFREMSPNHLRFWGGGMEFPVWENAQKYPDIPQFHLQLILNKQTESQKHCWHENLTLKGPQGLKYIQIWLLHLRDAANLNSVNNSYSPISCALSNFLNFIYDFGGFVRFILLLLFYELFIRNWK